MWNHLKMNVHRWLYAHAAAWSFIGYFWSKPLFHYSTTFGLAQGYVLCIWGEMVCVAGRETQLSWLCPCAARQEGWGHTWVPGENITGRMHYLSNRVIEREVQRNWGSPSKSGGGLSWMTSSVLKLWFVQILQIQNTLLIDLLLFLQYS